MLTDYYFLDIKDIFTSLADATDRVLERGAKGSLTISLPPSFAIQWLVPRLADFNQQHPEIDVRIKAVDMEDGALTISGERQTEKPEDAEGVRRFERVSGRFYRRFALPETADADGIVARSANGILEVSIPKQPEVQPRRITVEAA